MKKQSLKKLTAILLCLCISASLFVPLTAKAAILGECGENLTWSLEDGTLTISGTGEMSDFMAYNELNSRNLSQLTNIVVESGVTGICSDAFSGCPNLASVSLPDTLTTIEDSAFFNCPNLASISLPDTLTTIGRGVFYSCTGLTEISIPSSVTSIGNNVFYGCTSLTAINAAPENEAYSSSNGILFNSDKTELIAYPAGKTDTIYSIPESVTSLSSNVFSFCKSLTSVTIPSSVTDLPSDAFYGCASLTAINVAESNEAYTSTDGVLFSKTKARILTYPAGKTDASYTIPDGVTRIGSYAFSYSQNLESIIIPNSVTRINDEAFSDCTKLSDIIIPDGITIINEYTFYGCTSLASVTIPSSVEEISGDAFRNCSNLKTVYYTGSQADWGNIYIDYGNDCLEAANLVYDYSYITYITVDYNVFSEDENLIDVGLTVPEALQSSGGKIIYALYDGNMLIDIVITDAASSSGHTFENLATAKIGYLVSVLCVTDTTYLKPLCRSYLEAPTSV